MKILLRNKQTGLYYAHAHRWTDEASQAYHFNLEEYAINRAFAYRLQDIELVYEFPQAKLNFTIPVALFPPSLHERQMA
jgi:hypothetical protein